MSVIHAAIQLRIKEDFQTVLGREAELKEKAVYVCFAAVLTAACVTTKHKQAKARTMGKHVPYGIYEAVIKRPLDMVLGITALIIFSPVLGITALLVKRKLGSPVFYIQERPGRDEKIFQIHKFRTMTSQCGENGELLPDSIRLTPFGRILRSTSLDELPELVNIIRGDMAVVGPRPLLVEYLERYDKKQARRHEVRPGLTGAAQTAGRNRMSWKERFEEDVAYVDHITFLGDLQIVLKTIAVVWKKEGISSETSATMEQFTGTAQEDG